MMPTFGERLKAERLRLGISARQVSRVAGMSQPYAHMLEHGLRSPVTDGARAVASAMGLDLTDLLLDGPHLFEVEFDIGHRSAALMEIEQAMLASIPAEMLPTRVAVWPWSDDGVLRLRVRASCLPVIAGMTGTEIAGVSKAMPAPRIRPVAPCADLVVLVRAEGSISANRTVLARAAKEDCCPHVDIRPHGSLSLWMARLRSVPAACSLALQRISADSPVGIFVPADCW